MHQNYKLILASQSPRRQTLLKQLNLEYEIDPKDLDETYPPNLNPMEVPEYLARLKSDPFNGVLADQTAVITSDTVVISNGRIMGKPADATDALSMIMELSGKTHFVVTGVCIQTQTQKESFSNISEVTFEDITEEEARFYIDTFKPLDKAGAYGIQEWIGCARIKGIKGCYYNIMGLPLNAVYNKLREMGIISK